MPRKPRSYKERQLARSQQVYQFKAKETESNDNMSFVHAFMVLGYFVSCFLLLNYFPNAEMSIGGLFKLFCLLIGLSFLVPIKLYRKKLTMSMYEYIFLNVLGISTLGCALFFILNDSFSGQSYEETYRITEIERQHKSYVFSLEDNAYEDQEYIRTMKDKDNYEKLGNQFFTLQFADGLFGIRVIENKRLH